MRMHLTYVALHEVTWCTERAKMAAVLSGTSHVNAVSTPLRGYSKTRYKKLVAHVESHASAVSLLKSGEQRCVKAISNHRHRP